MSLDLEPNPYLAPSDGEVVPHRAPPGFTDQQTLVLVLTGMLGVQIALGVINTVACVALNAAALDTAIMLKFVDVTQWVATVHRALYLVTVVPFGMFLVRANKNAAMLSGASLEFSPGSMVWWFAVPFLNLVRPYQAVRQVWQASAPASDSLATPGILSAWWALWIASIVSSRVGAPFLRDAEPEVHNTIVAATSAIGVGLGIAAMLMVRALDARQRQRAAELAAE